MAFRNNHLVLSFLPSSLSITYISKFAGSIYLSTQQQVHVCLSCSQLINLRLLQVCWLSQSLSCEWKRETNNLRLRKRCVHQEDISNNLYLNSAFSSILTSSWSTCPQRSWHYQFGNSSTKMLLLQIKHCVQVWWNWRANFIFPR